MKRKSMLYTALLLVLALLCGLAGCGKEPGGQETTAPPSAEAADERETETANEEPNATGAQTETAAPTEAPAPETTAEITEPSANAVALYAPVVDWYAAAIRELHKDRDADYTAENPLPCETVQENGDTLTEDLNAALREMAIVPSACAYAYYDVNADGTSELLFLTAGPETAVNAIFTAVDSAPVLVGAFRSRYSVFPYGDGTLATVGSSGAMLAYYTYGTFGSDGVYDWSWNVAADSSSGTTVFYDCSALGPEDDPASGRVLGEDEVKTFRDAVNIGSYVLPAMEIIPLSA